jgi:hypothetical protein
MLSVSLFCVQFIAALMVIGIVVILVVGKRRRYPFRICFAFLSFTGVPGTALGYYSSGADPVSASIRPITLTRNRIAFRNFTSLSSK